ncbi:MAG TPA: hypothetical protein VFP39_13065 [Gemmatimonadales bacterium]|nr:hypothetical protein [Gemmatimonadales bacterium]
MLRRASLLALCALACSVDPHHSPVCGMALLVGPRLILDQLGSTHALLTDPPRGLPATLPARVVGGSDSTFVRVSSEGDHVELEFQGGKLPVVAPVDSTGRDSTVFGVLLVDDSTATVQGVLIFDRPRAPKGYPQIGRLADGERAVPLYGARVNWANVSNTRCPLLGKPVKS